MDNSSAVINTENSETRTNVLAIISLISGILGVFIFGSLIAVICGHIARGQIRESQGRETGDGLAVVGLILGYAMLVLTVLVIIAAVVFGLSLAALGIQ